MQLLLEELFYYCISFFYSCSLDSLSGAMNWPCGCRVQGAAWSHWPRGAQPGAQQPPALSPAGFPCGGNFSTCCVLWHQRRHKHSVWSLSMALLPALSHLCIGVGNEGTKLSDSGLNFWSNTSFLSVSLLISLTERGWNFWEGPGGNNSVHMPFAQSRKGETPPVLAFLETCK